MCGIYRQAGGPETSPRCPVLLTLKHAWPLVNHLTQPIPLLFERFVHPAATYGNAARALEPLSLTCC
jgi:hypothetical protein